jgi:hypothetical protein
MSNEIATTTLVRSLYRQLWRACKPAANYQSSGIRMLRCHLRESFREAHTVTDPITRETLIQRGK